MVIGNYETLKTVVSKHPQILSCGRSMINNLLKSMADAEMRYAEQKMKEELQLPAEEWVLTSYGTKAAMSFIDESTFEPPKQDISSLKKRIKHCKNHMEKKNLEKELNTLYKEQKRRK